jgi:geranylgeranyl reductase family protein
VVVVGAGPAGAAAALAARRADPGARVLLLDRAAFPRDKPCGDGIASQALDLLAVLGVADAAAGYPPVRLLRLEGPCGAVAERRMARPARVIPRAVFDARLVAAAVGCGVELRRGWVRRVEPAPGRARVCVRGAGDLWAHAVVGADGANGVVRGAVTGRPQPADHVAVAVRGYAPAVAASQRLVLDPARPAAYGWSFPVGDGRANVGYGAVLSRRGVVRADLVGRMHALIPESAGATQLRGHRLPLASWRPPQPDGPVLLAGDAAALINPLTGEGISYAVLSGALAGRAAVAGDDPGRRLRRSLRASLGRHHRDVGLAARAARGPRVLDAGVRVAARSQHLFDDLVELGLADGRLTARLLAGLAAELVRPHR